MSDEPRRRMSEKKHQPRMPLGANLPDNWVVGEENGCLLIKVPSWSLKGNSRIVTMSRTTSNLFCDCPGFTWRGDCHHVRGLIWFCSRPYNARHHGIQATSIESYHAMCEELMAERELEVVELLKKEGPLQSRLIAQRLGRPINCVTRPVLDLRDAGILEWAGDVYDAQTDRKVMAWKVVD